MGQTEIDQLTRIFSIIGTPNSNEWPTETHIMRSNFSIMHRKDLSELIPNIPTVAKDLIQVSVFVEIHFISFFLFKTYYNYTRHLFLFSQYFDILANACF